MIVIARCVDVTISQTSFKLRTVYQGHQLKLFVTMCSLMKNVKKGDEYILKVLKVRREGYVLYGEVEKYKKISEATFLL